MKVAIIGAGTGGIVAAADLTEKGHEVTLYYSKSALKDPHPNIIDGHVSFTGKLVHHAHCTQHPRRPEAEAHVIMTCLQTTTLLEIVKANSPHLKDGQLTYTTGESPMFSILIHQYSKATRPELEVSIG